MHKRRIVNPQKNPEDVLDCDQDQQNDQLDVRVLFRGKYKGKTN